MSGIAGVTRQEWASLSDNPKIQKALETMQIQSQSVSIAQSTLGALYVEIQALKVEIATIKQQIAILNSFNIETRLTALES
jgi:hypothetical protein